MIMDGSMSLLVAQDQDQRLVLPERLGLKSIQRDIGLGEEGDARELCSMAKRRSALELRLVKD